MYNACVMWQAIGQIRYAIDHDIVPWENPHYKKYWILLSEEDKQKFISEIKEYNLTLEDDTEEPKL